MAVESATAKRPVGTQHTGLRGLLALTLVAGALLLLGFGLAQTSTPLLVDVDGHQFQVRTHATTVGRALRHAGFDLYPEDLVSPGTEAPLQPGVVVQVRRAQLVALDADGRIHQMRTQAETVGEVLDEAGLQLGPADEIWVDGVLVEPGTPLRGGLSSPRQVSHRGGPRPMEHLDAPNPGEGMAGDLPLIVLRRAAVLTLEDDGVTTTLHTTLSTIGQVLQARGVTLFLGDQVKPGLQSRIKAGMAVTIRRSVPVAIEADGRVIHTRTRAETVAAVLGQEGVALVGKDTVHPPLDAPVRSDMTIRVTRVREEYFVEFDAIPFETEWIPDPEVEIDNIRIVRKGQIGLTKRRYRIVYENEQEVGRVLEDVWTAQSPVTKTMAYGTKIVVRTMDTPEGPIEYWRKMRVYTTSYMPKSCGKPKDHPRYGYTALGIKLKKGIVAVDPKVIPLRTQMYVPGYGLAKAADTGGGVRGKFVDLGFSDNDYQSWHWWTDIYLLTPVPPARKIRWILPDWPRYPDRKR